ncbi:MAG: 5-oxoprolinase subunit PxpB [Zoogloeaceae bacterium]|nr:5-oxoprolinase subunit PxpB [Zoogloeaceae bacterium]
MPSPYPRCLPLGEGALTIELGDGLTEDVRARVQGLDRALMDRMAAGGLVGVVEVVPAFRSLTVIFDPLLTDAAAVAAGVQAALTTAADVSAGAGRRSWTLPVCYDASLAPDLAEAAERLRLSVTELIAGHSGQEFEVMMLGFLPGFPFLGELPEALRLPRRTNPRVRVPPGSVAIAGAMTAIYPWESPGGWHLLGNCPVPLFSAARAAPALLAVGDRVRFQAISVDAFVALECERRAGRLDQSRFLESRS